MAADPGLRSEHRVGGLARQLPAEDLEVAVRGQADVTDDIVHRRLRDQSSVRVRRADRVPLGVADLAPDLLDRDGERCRDGRDLRQRGDLASATSRSLCAAGAMPGGC